MIQPSSQLVYLVYYNCRGIAQPIRYTLFEIGIEFEEIFLQSDGKIPSSVAHFKITPKNIPCIIHQNRVIHQTFPILKYLCFRFQRIDLLGKDFKSQAQLIEVMYRYERIKCANLMTIFRHISKSIKNPEKVGQIKQNLLKQIKQNTLGFEDACCQLYIDSGTFLFHDLTILDFIFYEKSFYLANIFQDIGKKRLALHFVYKNFFEKSNFYVNNKEKIQKYKILMPQFDSCINEGFQKLWVGDKRFFNSN